MSDLRPGENSSKFLESHAVNERSENMKGKESVQQFKEAEGKKQLPSFLQQRVKTLAGIQTIQEFQTLLRSVQVKVFRQDKHEYEPCFALCFSCKNLSWKITRCLNDFRYLHKHGVRMLMNAGGNVSSIPIFSTPSVDTDTDTLGSFVASLLCLAEVTESEEDGKLLCSFIDSDIGFFCWKWEELCHHEKRTKLGNLSKGQRVEMNPLSDNVNRGNVRDHNRNRKDPNDFVSNENWKSTTSPLKASSHANSLLSHKNSVPKPDEVSESDDDNFGFYGNDSDTTKDDDTLCDDDHNSVSDSSQCMADLWFDLNSIDFDSSGVNGAADRLKALNDRVSEYLKYFSLDETSAECRNKLEQFAVAFLKKALGAQSYVIGSSALKTAANSDSLRLSVFVSGTSENMWFAKVIEALCFIASITEHEAAAFPYNAADTSPTNENQELSRIAETVDVGRVNSIKVDKISFFPKPIEREISCSINGIGLNIVANRLDELSMIGFLEEIDRHVGQDHLFKKSIILVKGWMFSEHERLRQVSGSVRNLVDHMISVFMVCLFNVDQGQNIVSPFHAFVCFFQTFSEVNWEESVVTPYGVFPVSTWNECFESAQAHPAYAKLNSLINEYSPRYERAKNRLQRSYCSKSGLEDNLASVQTFSQPDSDGKQRLDAHLKTNCYLNLMDILDASSNIGTDLKILNPGLVNDYKAMFKFGAQTLKNAFQALYLQEIKLSAAHVRDEKGVRGRESGRRYADMLKTVFPHIEEELGDFLVSSQEKSASFDKTDNGSSWETALASAATAESDGLDMKTLENSINSIHEVTQSTADAMRKVASFPANMRMNMYDSVLSLESLNDEYGGFEFAEPSSTEADDTYVSKLAEIKESLQYCSLLLDSEVTSPALLSLSKEILKEKGALPVGEIGKMLQEATSNSQIPAILKEKFGGLKKFLELYPSVFLISADHPYNPKVYLKEELTDMEVMSIQSGASPPARMKASSVSSSSRKRKNGKKKSKGLAGATDRNRGIPNRKHLSGIRNSHSMVDLSQMNQYSIGTRMDYNPGTGFQQPLQKPGIGQFPIANSVAGTGFSQYHQAVPENQLHVFHSQQQQQHSMQQQPHLGPNREQSNFSSQYHAFQ